MNNQTTPETEQEKPTKIPDEKPGILVQSKIKIYDPESGKVFINQRA
jgi:hypothetical protein